MTRTSRRLAAELRGLVVKCGLILALFWMPGSPLIADEEEKDWSCYKANGCPNDYTCTGAAGVPTLCRVSCLNSSGEEVGWSYCGNTELE